MNINDLLPARVEPKLYSHTGTIHWVIDIDEGGLVSCHDMPAAIVPPNIGDKYAESTDSGVALYKVVDRIFVAEGEDWSAPTIFSWKLSVTTIFDHG